MPRREFFALFGGATAASVLQPAAAGAQTPAKIPRVGYVAGSNAASTEHMVGAFRQRLRELGYVEGKTVALEVRYAEGRSERMPELVAELVGLKVDILVAGNSVAAVTARKATGATPIVIVTPDPVALGLVASLARPGGNVTGVSYSMKRRAFMALVAGAAGSMPLTMRAQQAAGRIYRVGYLTVASREQQLHLINAFEESLQSLGYRIGGNVVIKYRFAMSVLEGKAELIV
jgi:ABC-type uncharacterized transport system substrate-binding protein